MPEKKEEPGKNLLFLLFFIYIYYSSLSLALFFVIQMDDAQMTEVGANPNTIVAPQRTITIHILEGGHWGNQTIPFRGAMRLLNSRFHPQGISLNEVYKVRKNIRESADFDPQDLVDWLASADIHIISTHPSQANTDIWNVTDMFIALENLRGHTGFPAGPHLECPVFTQHKYKYLNLLPKFMITPTHCVSTQAPLSDEARGMLESFLAQNNEGKGWIVKLPFVTNGDRLCRCKSVAAVHSTIERFVAECHNIPYCMVQPCLANGIEYKVVFLEGRYSHVLIPHKKMKGLWCSLELCLFSFAR
jgi:hypothetical protein